MNVGRTLGALESKSRRVKAQSRGNLYLKSSPGEKDGDSVTSFVMESFANVDGRGFQEQRYMAHSWRRLLQGPVVEIDNKAAWAYNLWQSNEGQDASLRIEMGKPK